MIFDYLIEAYKVKDVIINGESVGAVSNYTFTNVDSDQTVRVKFEKIKHPVNILIGSNGSTDHVGIVEVEHDSSIIINITPDKNFVIDFIKVNGAPAEISNAFTLNNVTNDMLIEIAFKQVMFNITTESYEGGTVTPSLSVSVGESAKIDFSADAFYKVKDVKIDGVGIGNVKNYIFVNVKQNHTVSVEYGPNKLMVAVCSSTTAILIGFAVLSIPVIKKRNRYWHMTKHPKEPC